MIASKHNSSNAGSSDVPKRNHHKVLHLSDKVNMQDISRGGSRRKKERESSSYNLLQ
jgi:hypothetical protein